MKYVVLSLSVIFLTACSGVRVTYDYDRETDYSNYTTYNYYADMQTGLSQLDTKRLLDAIDSTMQTKGILLAEEPDFFVNISSNSFKAPRNNTVGVGVGGTGGNLGGGLSIGLPIGQPNLERQIQFDFVDSQKDALFWQAISESSFKDNLSPSAREAKLKQIVEKVFLKYPPKQK
ncbi:MAG: DUF4136 domain-containing protein [Sediminicola sp.]